MAVVHKSTEAFKRAMTFSGVAECPGDGRWEIPTDSDICTEVETIALAFGFVRMRRPAIVVETGCNVGCMTRALAEALAVNGSGLLFSCDIEKQFVAVAQATVPSNVTVTCETGLELIRRIPDADLYWLDSAADTRVPEIEYLRTHGRKGTIILAHDTACYGDLNACVRSFERSVVLPGPRGLGVITL